MKKIINGKTYNTKTARRIGTRSNNLPQSDFDHFCEEMYIAKDGRYFLAGEGGARTKYGSTLPDGWRAYGEDIIPITAAEALEWAEWYMEPDDFRAEFPTEAEAKEMKRLADESDICDWDSPIAVFNTDGKDVTKDVEVCR